MNGEDRGGINVTGRKTESNGRELNYLEWLSAHTPTKWWHDSAIPDEIERGLSMGALGITTNPVLTYKTFNACPDYWRDRVAAVPDELDFAARAEEMLRIRLSLPILRVCSRWADGSGPGLRTSLSSSLPQRPAWR